MRISFSDPQGPLAARLAPYTLPLALFLGGTLGPTDASSKFVVALASITLVHALGLLPRRQTKAVTAELRIGPGHVRISGAALRSQNIHARDIVGTTTARTPEGHVALSLAHAKRDTPLTLVANSEEEAERIRHALGIGFGGMGAVGWCTVPTQTARSGVTGRLVAALIFLALTIATAFAGVVTALLLGVFLVQLGVICSVISLIGHVGRRGTPSVLMTREGLRLSTKDGWFSVPYDHVLDVEVRRDHIGVLVPAPYHRVEVPLAISALGRFLSNDECEALKVQVLSASARARGFGARQREQCATHLEALRRRGAAPREWLARLDAAAGMLGASAVGYRDQSFDIEDLWSVLEDPDADSELRTAAARVLSRASDARIRVHSALEAVRDPVTKQKLRLAVECDDEASPQELAPLYLTA